MKPTAPSSMNAAVADKSSSASASDRNSRSNDLSLPARPSLPLPQQGDDAVKAQHAAAQLHQHLAAIAELGENPLELAIAPPRRGLHPRPLLAR